jgi:hypothetical protein
MPESAVVSEVCETAVREPRPVEYLRSREYSRQDAACDLAVHVFEQAHNLDVGCRWRLNQPKFHVLMQIWRRLRMVWVVNQVPQDGAIHEGGVPQRHVRLEGPSDPQ